MILLIALMGCEKNNTLSLSIEPLKNYSLNYSPCFEEKECDQFFYLPDLPQNVQYTIEKRKIDDEFILYNTLIMLKLYRAHLERAHQSYDLRPYSRSNKNPILQAFHKYSGVKITGEFLSSSISYEWVLKQQRLLDNPIINKELKRIKLVLDNIDKGVYWGEPES